MDLEQLALVMFVLIASLTFHEAAHAFAADRLGDSTSRQLGRLSLNPVVHIDPIGTLLFPLIAFYTGFPLIGWAKPVPVDTRRLRHPTRDFAVIAAAGPASNVVLALVAVVLLELVQAFAVPGDIAALAVVRPLIQILRLFVYLNVLLAVFNMIPVPPLDGGNVLMGLLPPGPARVMEQLRPYGFLILYALMLTGVLGSILGPVLDYVRYLLGV